MSNDKGQAIWLLNFVLSLNYSFNHEWTRSDTNGRSLESEISGRREIRSNAYFSLVASCPPSPINLISVY